MNRREFLTSGSVTVASLALASTAAIEFVGSAEVSASPLGRATFARCLDTAFQLQHSLLGPIELTLTRLLDHQSASGEEQFTLIFRGPQNGPLAGGTFVMAHAATGRFPLYLESAGHDEGGPLFRADFNLAPA